jgi:hypothetical protein
MTTATFQQTLAPLFPELGGEGPDPDRYADAIVVRVLNLGSARYTDAMLAFYGMARVRAAAQSRVNRLDAPVYRAWRDRLELPQRSAAVERLHALWRR